MRVSLCFSLASVRMRAAMLGLASAATSAGLAMACPFGSCDQVEAAVSVRRGGAACANAGRATPWPPSPLSSWFLFYFDDAERPFRAAPQSYSGVLALVGAGLKPRPRSDRPEPL